MQIHSLTETIINMKIEEIITTATATAVKVLYNQDIPQEQLQIQKTKKEFEGHLTLVVFPLLRISRKKPEETAQEIGEWLAANCEAVEKFNVVKGFLNLTISPDSWIYLLNDIRRRPLRPHHTNRAITAGDD